MLRWVGDSAVLAEFDGEPERANATARAVAAAAGRVAGVEEAVPGARTVLFRLALPARGVWDQLYALVHTPPEAPRDADAVLAIGVAYDGEDLTAVAEAAGMTTDDVVREHSSAVHKVAFCGFMPGFAYMMGVPARLHLPRRATPRTRVPAGSVAIAAGYTGIYPSDAPGGWHVIGRCDARLFDPSSPRPALLRPGLSVRFEPR